MVNLVLSDMRDAMADLWQREAEREYTYMDSDDGVDSDVSIWRGEEYRSISIYGTGSDKGAIRKERSI